MSYNLLLVDDDKEVLQLNAKYLSSLNYNVKICTRPSVVTKLIEEYNPDCIILDIMMPELDGRSLCTKIRKASNIPILFLSGKTTEDDKIQGLLLGADDYITKPYSFKELEARIRTHIRRHKSAVISTLLRFPPLSIDTMNRRAFYNEEEIDLSNREYNLLLFLASNKNTIITFEEIACKMWGTYTESDRRSIMVTTSRLRKKLNDYSGLANMIETVWSQGYRFITK